MAQKKRKADTNSDPKTERPGVIRTGQFRRSNQRSGANSAAGGSEQARRDQAARNEPYQEDDEEQSPRDRYMSIGEHLEELRKRIIWAVGVILAAALVGG